MDKTQVTVKIWKDTRDLLRMIYALTGESIASIIHRLASEELERVRAPEDRV